MTRNQSSIFRAFNHLACAKEYFQDVCRDAKRDGKVVFGGYVNKIDWMLKDTKHRLSSDMQQAFERELERGDTMWMDAMLDNVAELSQENRTKLESIIIYMLKEQKNEHANSESV